jgi:hypothetical protein
MWFKTKRDAKSSIVPEKLFDFVRRNFWENAEAKTSKSLWGQVEGKTDKLDVSQHVQWLFCSRLVSKRFLAHASNVRKGGAC